ncbi:MAG: hypothetical protein JNM56_26040 [Planctomycetia bacterium]|nr:hypothetical protein [Planctomycetia bacterium]
MSQVTTASMPLDSHHPAERLRRVAAAVRVHFTWWGVRRALTAQQKEEIGVACAADARLLTAGKKLVDVRHEAFRKLTALRTRIGQFWRSVTLPYVEPGVRLIKQSGIDAFVHQMEGFREELAEAEANLSADYDQVKADARNRLGRLYNAADYPPEIRGLFAVDFDFPSVEPPNYLLQLNPEIYAEEQARVARRFEEAVQLAEQAFIGELAKLVAHLTERLTAGPDGERKTFRDSAIANLTDYFARFRDLNVRSNAQLDQLVEQAQQIVRGVAPQDLRDNTGLRQHVATQLAAVQATLDGMLVDQPRRRIIRARPGNNGGNHDPGH